MSCIRKRWLSRPDLLIRVARHYEGGVQILIRNAVKSAKEVIFVVLYVLLCDTFTLMYVLLLLLSIHSIDP